MNIDSILNLEYRTKKNKKVNMGQNNCQWNYTYTYKYVHIYSTCVFIYLPHKIWMLKAVWHLK